MDSTATNNIAMKWKELTFKDKLSYIFAISAFTIGWLVTIAGFIIPPMGVVHETVLWILGQSLLFSGSIVGISQYYQSQLMSFKHSIRQQIDNRVREYEEQQMEQ